MENFEKIKDTVNWRDLSLYSKTFLDKQLRYHFITIPHTTIEKKDIYDNLLKLKSVTYMRICKEKHKDGEDHLHLIVACKNKVKTLMNKIILCKGEVVGQIDFKEVKSMGAALQYLEKEDKEILEYGDVPKYIEKNNSISASGMELLNYDLNLVINDTTSTLEEKMEKLKQTQPAYYIQHKEKIKAELELDETRKKWEVPDMDKDSVELKSWQQELWSLINKPPKARRIIWVHGKPNMGKSFMYSYMETNYDYKVYNAGQSASLDNVVYGYDEEGVICWDIPKNYDWEQLGDSLACVIEKFSDFGQHLTSKKYSGKKVQVRGHCVVFSNRPPIKQLMHRDIIEVWEKTDTDDNDTYKLDDLDDMSVISSNTVETEETISSTHDDILRAGYQIIVGKDKKKYLRHISGTPAFRYPMELDKCYEYINR